MNASQPHPPMDADQGPSDWVVRFGARVAPAGAVLDVACGAGRHARWFAGRGHPVDAVDREPPPAAPEPSIRYRQADIEVGPWPYDGRQFAVVVVTNYLHRPLFPALIAAVEPGGWLIYETFAAGNEAFGRPARPAFLLNPDELLTVVRGQLSVAAFEHGYFEVPRPAMRQRIAAWRPLS